LGGEISSIEERLGKDKMVEEKRELLAKKSYWRW